MNLEEVSTTIAQGNRAAGEAAAAIAKTADRIQDARRLAAVTGSSEHEKVKLGKERLREAAAEAERVFKLLRSAAQAADEFRRALR